MPGQSGLELQEELRSRGYQMPVILKHVACTRLPEQAVRRQVADGIDKDRTRALNNGAVAFGYAVTSV